MSSDVNAQTLNRMAARRMELLDREIANLEAALTQVQKEYQGLYAMRMAYEEGIDLIRNEDVPDPMFRPSEEAF